MAIPHPIPEALAELIAQRFRILGDLTRIRILDTLRAGPASVQDLADRLGASQQNVSKHLGLMHGVGMLDRRREGNRVIYSIGDESVLAICENVCGGVQRQVAALSSLVAPQPVV